jgi:hypothetical protein
MEPGLLDLSIELSTRDITAGKEFALFQPMKNPYNKPVRNSQQFSVELNLSIIFL